MDKLQLEGLRIRLLYRETLDLDYNDDRETITELIEKLAEITVYCNEIRATGKRMSALTVLDIIDKED